MTLTLELSPEIEAQLRTAAQNAGREFGSFAAYLLGQSVIPYRLVSPSGEREIVLVTQDFIELPKTATSQEDLEAERLLEEINQVALAINNRLGRMNRLTENTAHQLKEARRSLHNSNSESAEQ